MFSNLAIAFFGWSAGLSHSAGQLDIYSPPGPNLQIGPIFIIFSRSILHLFFAP
jgi:hypothetical protein